MIGGWKKLKRNYTKYTLELKGRSERCTRQRKSSVRKVRVFDFVMGEALGLVSTAKGMSTGTCDGSAISICDCRMRNCLSGLSRVREGRARNIPTAKTVLPPELCNLGMILLVL